MAAPRAGQTGSRRAGDEGSGLKRVIGTKLLFFFILGDMLGGGIYALVGRLEPKSAARSGRPSSPPSCWRP